MIELSYYPGCSLHASAKLYDVQNTLVFERLGVKLKELDDWNCCGATSAAKTDKFLSIAMPARNIGIADASGNAEVLIPCSSCYSRTLVAQKELEADPALKDEINEELDKKIQLTSKVVSINDLLLRVLDTAELPEDSAKKLKDLKPACYYGCLLTRFPSDMNINDDVENPQGMERVLAKFGAKSVDWAFKTDCCGASASVNDADVSIKLMSAIFKDAIDRGANCIVTTCPMCQFNLDAYQGEVAKKYSVGGDLPVYYITEIIGIALGIDPHSMQMDRHLVDAMELIKELELI